MRIRYCLFLLFCFQGLMSPALPQDSYVSVFSKSEAPGFHYLDSLAEELALSSDPSKRVLLLNDLAYFWHTRNLNRADSLARIGKEEARRANLKYSYALLQVSHAAILLRKEKLDEAEMELRQASEILRKEDLPLAYAQYGYIAERRGDLEKAGSYANLNYELGGDLNNLWAKALALSDLSNIFWKQGKFLDGVEYGLKSLALFEERDIEDMDYSFTLFLLGMNYQSLAEPREAERYLNESIRISEKFGFYNNLSDAYIVKTDLLSSLGDFQGAHKSFAEALKYARLLDNAFLEMRSWLSLGKLYNEEKNFREAVLSLQNSLDIATTKFGDDFWLSEVYGQLSRAYIGQGFYKEGYETFVNYETHKDSVLTLEANRRLSEIQTLYETAAKEATITEQKARISGQNTLIIVVLSGLLVMILAGIVLFRLNRKLAEREKEKDYLLKETHHRVKNNLQILSSLLSLQSEYIHDAEAQSAIKEGRNRVESMGMIHQRLYTQNNLTAVDIRDYLSELCSHLRDSYTTDQRTIKIEHEIQLGLVDVETAIPLGLIVNELVTNSIKYAFSEADSGTIRLALWVDDRRRLCLRVADDGKKVSLPGEKIKEKSFGTELVRILAKKLKGSIQINRDQGYSTFIAFERYKLI